MRFFSTKLPGPLYGLFQFSLTPVDPLMSVGFYDYTWDIWVGSDLSNPIIFIHIIDWLFYCPAPLALQPLWSSIWPLCIRSICPSWALGWSSGPRCCHKWYVRSTTKPFVGTMLGLYNLTRSTQHWDGAKMHNCRSHLIVFCSTQHHAVLHNCLFEKVFC